MHVLQFVQAFLLDRRSSGCSQKTLEWHEASLMLFVRWLEDNDLPTDPDKWTTTLIRQYIVHMQTRNNRRGKPLSGASVNSYVGSLLAFFRFLYVEELIEKNLADRIKKPARPKVIKRPFTNEELSDMFAVARETQQGLRDVAILSLMLDTGLRAAEVVNLRIGDILVSQGLIIVRQGKGAKDRVVPLSPKVGKSIMRYQLKGRPESDTDMLFVSPKGVPLLPNALRLMVQRIAKKAGIQGATAHRWRRTFATNYLRNGGNLYDLQTLMGHVDISITTTYLSADEESLKRSHETASPLSKLKNST